MSAYEPAWISVAIGVQVVRARAAGRDDVAADRRVRARRAARIGDGDEARARVAIGQQHRVALVAHDAAHGRARAARGRSARPRGVGRIAAAARQADVHVDRSTSRTPPSAAASIVASESTATVTRASSCAEAPRVEHLVREQHVVAEPGGDEALAPRGSSRT